MHMRDAYMYSARELQRIHIPALVSEVLCESVDVELIGTYRDNRCGWCAEDEDILYRSQAVVRMDA